MRVTVANPFIAEVCRVRCTIALLIAALLAAPSLAGDVWPQFRGPTQDGVSDSVGLPATMPKDAARWRCPIPGEGWSSPVILGNQVWLTTATEAGHALRAVCVDREAGTIVHDVEVFTVEPVRKNAFNSYASPSPVLEGGRVYVCFGTYGSACLDAATAKTIWKNEELKLDHKEGPGSSPIIYKSFFILHCDGQDVQYIVALDKNTGKQVWKTNRSSPFPVHNPDMMKAFCTPVLASIGGRDELVSIGAQRLYGYDAMTGGELWHVDIPGFSNVPMPLVSDGTIYLSTGFLKPELWAIKAGGSGDVTADVKWKVRTNVPAKPSLALVDGLIYMVNDTGVLQAIDAKTGEQVWQAKLEGKYTASPVVADGKIYFCSEDGKVTVIEPGRTFKVLGESRFGERMLASPAVVGHAIYLRTDAAIYRFEK